ncbi:hypothetical protein A9K55_000433 [Cordyceps militaris]|uniref:Uncharacterized protein n=1 Tax=Cordyceps militaris TaxID=73501 RepID=A0A2H4SVM2_CORMI|nr:hypothetical protein A9K55_000433 [Cordyceps militaris]
MKLSSLLATALVAPTIVAGYGIRGAAERALYYLLYLAEELLPQDGMELAVGCTGSRTGLNGVANRCYFGEFLKHIEPPNTGYDLDKIMIMGTTNELGTNGLYPGWGRQKELVDGVGDFSESKTAVQIMGDGIEKFDYKKAYRWNPPPEYIVDDFTRWREANPNWSAGMPSGEGITESVFRLKKGRPNMVSITRPGGVPYQKYLNYENLDGISRDPVALDKFQEFFTSLSDHQRRIYDGISELPDDHEHKTRGFKLLDMISWAGDRTVEPRVQDHWSIVVDGKFDPKKPQNEVKGLRHPDKFGPADVVVKTVHGRWGSYEIPDLAKTVEKAIASHRVTDEVQGKELWDTVVQSDVSKEHMNVINDFRDTVGDFHGHSTMIQTVC